MGIQLNTKRLKNEKHLDQVGPIAFSPSTLIIPGHRLDFFLMRKQQFDGISKYFSYLLVRYASKLIEYGIWPQYTSDKWKKQYQKQGMIHKK